MSEIIKLMGTVKMYRWESAFEKKVRQTQRYATVNIKYKLDCLELIVFS